MTQILKMGKLSKKMGPRELISGQLEIRAVYFTYNVRFLNELKKRLRYDLIFTANWRRSKRKNGVALDKNRVRRQCLECPDPR